MMIGTLKKIRKQKVICQLPRLESKTLTRMIPGTIKMQICKDPRLPITLPDRSHQLLEQLIKDEVEVVNQRNRNWMNWMI